MFRDMFRVQDPVQVALRGIVSIFVAQVATPVVVLTDFRVTYRVPVQVWVAILLY